MEEFYTDLYKRVWGNKNIGGSIEVTAENNEVVIQVDGVDYTLDIPSGSYKTEYTTSTSELVNAIKEQITTKAYPLEVYLGGNHKDEKFNVTVFRSAEDKEIASISGSFYNEFFSN